MEGNTASKAREARDARPENIPFELVSQADPGDRVRYIGSKARIADSIVSIIGTATNPRQRFLDLFSGTGAVARAAALLGWRVVANDYLSSSILISKARMLAREDVPFRRLGGYFAAIAALNASKPVEGPIFCEYTPSGRSRSGHLRKYFSIDNGRCIDGARQEIGRWLTEGVVTRDEADLLIADLLAAANGVANIAGTYGCFLSNWTPTSLRPLCLAPRPLLLKPVAWKVTNEDAFAFHDNEDDVLYVDPPYTKRQYAAYYHLLETIAIGDHPPVAGKTGLRSWEHKSSPFCYKRRALEAFRTLLCGKRANHVYVSYSSEGHVSLDALVEVLSGIGHVSTYLLSEIARYAPNAKARRNAKPVQEYLLAIART